MTWKEFKKAVDDELERQGASEDFEVVQIEFDGESSTIMVDTTSTFFGIEIEG